MTSAAPDGPVLVVGAGLIGASVGMALERAGVKTYLHDVDRTAAHVASSRGAGSDDPAPDDVALVVVATPPDLLGTEIERALAAYPDAVVTDVGSVKVRPLADLIAAGVDPSRYVGGHPMAGSERSGPLASAPDLFDGRAWAVVAHDAASPEAVAVVEWLATTCGAVATRMTAGDHDLAVARISHLPHLVAALAAGQLSAAPPEHLALSGQGVRDVTRIAAGDPVLWKQIVSANAAPLTDLLLSVRDGIDELVASLGDGDQERVQAVLAAGVAGTDGDPRQARWAEHGAGRDHRRDPGRTGCAGSAVRRHRRCGREHRGRPDRPRPGACLRSRRAGRLGRGGRPARGGARRTRLVGASVAFSYSTEDQGRTRSSSERKAAA